MKVDGVYIELSAAEPDKLASFYERLAGFERAGLTPNGVLLRTATCTISIRRATSAIPDPTENSPGFGFVMTPTAGSDAIQEELASAGAVVLSESKREGRRTLLCSDPEGNEFTVLVSSNVAPSAETSLAVIADSDQAPRPSSSDASPQDTPAAGMPLPAKRYTRRDLDRLRDMERLAQMQETIAGLNMGFSHDDPASVLDEMRVKVGPGFDARATEEHDAVLRQQQRVADGDSLLDRYKKELLGRAEVASAAPVPPKQEEENSEGDAIGLGKVRRSLGGSGESDE